MAIDHHLDAIEVGLDGAIGDFHRIDGVRMLEEVIDEARPDPTTETRTHLLDQSESDQHAEMIVTGVLHAEEGEGIGEMMQAVGEAAAGDLPTMAAEAAQQDEAALMAVRDLLERAGQR